MTDKRNILLVDAYGVFVRQYQANPTISSNGTHMGGVVGFLKSLRWAIDKTFPKKVIVIWEGGGSTRRRSIYPGYKSGRKPLHMNRFFEEEIPDTYENRNKQITTLISILTCLPVCQIYTPDCEADDVIAYLCNYRFKNESKVIFSSDSDFYQLLDDNTEICTLTRNKWIKSDSVLQEFSVYPRNFCLLKAMKGDSADNIPGVKGAGFKTIIKRFPFIKEDRDVLIDEILKHSQDQLKSKIKLYQSVIDSEQDLRRNWRIMYLDSSFLTLKQIKKINDSIDSFSPKLKRLDVTRILIKEGLNTIDLSWLFFPMNYLISGEV